MWMPESEEWLLFKHESREWIYKQFQIHRPSAKWFLFHPTGNPHNKHTVAVCEEDKTDVVGHIAKRQIIWTSGDC